MRSSTSAPLSRVEAPHAPPRSISTAPTAWEIASASCAAESAELLTIVITSSRSLACRAASAAASDAAEVADVASAPARCKRRRPSALVRDSCWLSAPASELARPMLALASPVAEELTAMARRASALAASSTTAPTLSGCSAVVKASKTSETRTESVQLPSTGSHDADGTTLRLPRELGGTSLAALGSGL